MNRKLQVSISSGFVASVLLISNALSEEVNRTISIASPTCGGTFSCEAIRDNQCFFTVKGAAKNLQDGDYVSLMLKIAGGAEWWQGGNSVGFKQDFDDSWAIGMVSVDPAGISKNFVGRVIITDSPLVPGHKYSVIPKNFGTSAFCQWTLQ